MMRRTLILTGACSLLAAAIAVLCLLPLQPAEASFTSDSAKDLVAYIKGSHALNMRLQALDALRKLEDSGIEDELAQLARGKDLRIAVFGATQLGKKQSSAAKTCLKGLVTDTGVGTEVRKAAMTAIAVHFRSSSDLDWLEEVTEEDSTLKGHCSWLETNIYKR